MSKLTRYKIRFYTIESIKGAVLFLISMGIGFAVARFDGWTFQQHPFTLVMVTAYPFYLLTNIFLEEVPKDWAEELRLEPYRQHPWRNAFRHPLLYVQSLRDKRTLREADSRSGL